VSTVSQRLGLRWLTIAMVVGLAAINYLDRGAIAYAVRPLSAEFGISPADYGLISSAFAIGYMVFALLSGPLIDRYGTRRILLLGMLVWSVATALTPVAGGFTGLLLIRILLGAGEAPAFPSATRIAGRWLRSTERGFALALIGGVSVSATLLVSGPILTRLIDALGWRGMFWILTGVGVLWALAATRLLYDKPADHPRISPAERAHIEAGQTDAEKTEPTGTGLRAVLANRAMWVIGFGYFAWGFMFWGFMYWLPEYLTSFGLSIKQVGVFTVAPWAAGLLGAAAGGIIVDRIYARTRRARSRFVVIGTALALSGSSLVPVIVAPSLTTALVSISLGVGFGFVTGGIWWVVSIDASPGHPATAAGFADAAFALSGIVAPTVMGVVVQVTDSFTSGFVVMAVLAVGASTLFFTTNPRVGTTERDLPMTPAPEIVPQIRP
jgi:predicted MFS family arabinose efflux permease